MRRLLLRLYPPAWRRRYGEEFAALLDQRPLGPREIFDLLRGAADARLHRVWRRPEQQAAGTATPGRRRAGRMETTMRRGKVDGYSCSFCGKGPDRVRHLIAGPQGVRICDECVTLCNQILDEQNRRSSQAPNDPGAGERAAPACKRSRWRRVLAATRQVGRHTQSVRLGRLPL